MRLWILPLLAVVALAGCTRKEETTTTTVQGQYQGIGVYNAGQGWARIAVPPVEEGSRAATLADDDHVIVVTNSQTGEVRQCGDLSGYCITLNPWAQTLDATRAAPVALEPVRDEKGRVVKRERLVAPAAEATTTETAVTAK
jgi:hypothetical protein